MATNTAIHSMPHRARAAPVVFVLHSDRLLRASLELLIRESGWQPLTFIDAETLLSQLHATGPACLILDLDGLELQSLLASRPEIPVIFIADNPSVRTTVRAMKSGAIEVLASPVDESLLRDSIVQALHRSSALQGRQAERLALHRKYQLLSRREREVMQHVVRGALNKNIAADLGITEVTVKAHRGQVMRKMQASTLPDLVNMARVLRLLVSDSLAPAGKRADMSPLAKRLGKPELNLNEPAR